MKILMLGVYDINGYSRGRILYKGLKKNNVDVNLFLGKGKLKYLKLAFRLLKRDFDVIIATGKLVLLVSLLMKIIYRKPLVFDVFISDYDTLVEDRKIVKKNSITAKMLRFSDKLACKFSEFCILDTRHHIGYFVKEFNLNKLKFKEILVGADDSIFFPRSAKTNKNEFVVYFQGTFIPLQGIEHIIKAAKLLEKFKNIKFEIIGSGQTYKEMIDLSKKLKVSNVTFHGMKKLSELPEYVAKADVCLGIFGNTNKAKRVIPNKVYEMIAMKKPLITTDTPAARIILENGKNALLVPVADSVALADAIKRLKTRKELRTKLANNGYSVFCKCCNTIAIGREMKNYLNNIINRPIV